MKKKLINILILSAVIFLSACEKELSTENSSTVGNELIVGKNCRIAKMVYNDTATGINLGSLAATINILDRVDQINAFDSLAVALTFAADITHTNDTIYLNVDEYFVLDLVNNRIKRLHGLTDPTDILSPQFDADYSYNAAGYLIQKNYLLSPGAFPLINVAYTYTGNNLTKMTYTNLISGEVEVDADMQYYPTISPQNYMYIFPDEFTHPEYVQFFNFGKKSANAIKKIKLSFYNSGVAVDSLVSNFASYRMSRDNYVLDVIMSGDDQPAIPAPGGSKIKFSYKCK